ncbi:MAG: hypothetical protein K9L82_19130, partial [Chromatiaceae bacterium]|nr:hypothetical protein [Chromatiaceae bacterium]
DDDQLLYLDRAAGQTLLFADRRLSQRFIAERTQAVLGQVLGRSAAAAQSQLGSAPAPAPPAVGATAEARDYSPLVDEDD